jgi:cell division septal protein FtsQ
VLILLIGLGGLGVAAAFGFRELGAWLFSRNPRFTIREGGLDLQSTGRLQYAHLRDYARLAEGMNLFALDLDEVRNNLLGVPLIKSAQVERLLPDRLRVRVSERVAVARLVADNGFQFAVDREGVVLGPSSRGPTLPLLAGVHEPGLSPGTLIRASRFQDALETIEHCESAGLGRYFRLGQISIEPEDYLDVKLASGTRVLLGRLNLRWRLDQLALILQDATSKRKAVVSVDLTVDSNFPVLFAQR